MNGFNLSAFRNHLHFSEQEFEIACAMLARKSPDFAKREERHRNAKRADDLNTNERLAA